jgi:hypothetical protein
MKIGFGLLRPTFKELLHWRHVAVGKAVQESENVFNCDLVDGSITEFFDIPLNDGPISDIH